MDINSQQQINTFVGGMNTDTSDALLDSNQYRYAENLRIVTNTDSNSGELRIIDGILTLIDKYINKDTDSKRWDEILYMTSVRQYLILITKVINKQTNIAGWSIYRWEEGEEEPDLIFGLCGEAIWDESGNTNLSVVTRYESELNIKMYIVDGIHQIMCINIYDTPSDESSAPKDIKFLTSSLENPIEPLSVLISENAGELKAAKVLYAYRLYKKYGSVTTLSPLSNILSLYKDNNSGYEKGAKTGRAVNICTPNKTYEHVSKILIFRINYIENGQEPTVTLIMDGDYIANSNIIDDGTKDINTVSLSELLSYIQIGIIPKELETKHNYLFAGNIKYTTTDIDRNFKNLNLSEFIDISFFQDEDKYYIINDELLDYDGLSQHSTFRPGETYRFGVIFYDPEGNKSSVFHLKDLTVEENLSTSSIKSGEEINYEAKPIGVKIKQKQSIPNCSHFEIVRCIRTLNDKRTISQGIIGRPAELFKNTWDGFNNSYSTTKTLAHSGYMSMNSFKMIVQSGLGQEVTYFSKPASEFMQFASPEYCYQPDDIKNILNLYKNNLTIKTVHEYATYTSNGFETTSAWGTVSGNLKTSTKTLCKDKHPYKLEYGNISSYYAGIVSTNELYIRDYTQAHNLGTTFNILYPKYERLSLSSSAQYNVNEFAYPEVHNWNDMTSGENIICNDAVKSIGGYTYHEWSNPFLSLVPNGSGSRLREMWLNGTYNTIETRTKAYFPVGSGGKHILIKTSTEFPESYEKASASGKEITMFDGPFIITIADLRKTANPYGGTSAYAKENSVYFSFGLVFENKNTKPEYEEFFGDSYIRMFKYNALHTWYDATYNHEDIAKMATVYCVPIVSDIDLHAQFGTLYTRNMTKPYYLLDEPAAFDGYVQETGAYLYNTAYNQSNTAIPYSAYKEEDNKDSYDVRVHYSELKTNNEHIDNWTLFKSMNFLEVDSSFGLITDLKLFKDRLIFWQEHATGILAVNERVILQDANNTQVVLGTGSVLDRYDYISTTYGMKPKQHSSCVSDDYLYWWDGYNKEILQYAEKYSATPLSLVKNIRNYINQNEESNKPHIYYNRKYKEVGCQCLKNGNNSNGEVIAYNELLQRFTSVYTARNIDRSINYGFAPIYDTYLNGNLLITDGNSVYKQSLNKETSLLFDNLYVQPYLKYIVNTNNTLGKTYDMQIIGGNLYNSKDEALTVDSKLEVIDFEKVQRFLNQPSLKDEPYNHQYHTTEHLKSLQLRYTTPLKQEGVIKDGKGITNREYDYRLNIPRETGNDVYGGRLRGKTMQCELWSTSSSTDFSLQYITTKYRMSWS